MMPSCRSMAIKLIILTFIPMLFPWVLFAEILKGTLYEIASNRQKSLYQWEMTLTPSGMPWKSIYRSLNGTISAKDEVIWDGDSFKGYRYERSTINDQGSVMIHENSVMFQHTIDGKRKENTERYVNNFTSGPMVIIHILNHWDELMQGNEKSIRYGVIDQTSSFGFVLSRDINHNQNNSGRIVFKMDADSFLIGLVVDPIYFIFKEKNRELVGMIGRMLPVGVNEEGRYAINAELVIKR